MSGLSEHTAALEALIFSSESACKVASAAPVGHPSSEKALHDADTALTQLQSLLGYFSAASELEQFHSQPLLSDCLGRLARLRLRHSQTSTRYGMQSIWSIFAKQPVSHLMSFYFEFQQA